ncbi:MAG: GIY-YIG nuclease family protein [Acidobacteriota bacterium]
MEKRHILDEIRRTATANSGNALGKDRFFTETGIKESDWLGKHWIRWSEAVRDAGLIPNRMAEAYPDEFLILRLVALCREVGRFPVRGDLRMKARRDPEFPGDKAFNRLGSKDQLVRRVADYCRSHEGFQDVLELCPAMADRAQHTHGEEAGTEEIGFVYLIKSGRYYKIGRSNSSGRREYELAIQLPERANKVHEIRTDDPVGIEAYWHNRFEKKRKNGEWFDLTALDIKAFRRRKFM